MVTEANGPFSDPSGDELAFWKHAYEVALQYLQKCYPKENETTYMTVADTTAEEIVRLWRSGRTINNAFIERRANWRVSNYFRRQNKELNRFVGFESVDFDAIGQTGGYYKGLDAPSIRNRIDVRYAAPAISPEPEFAFLMLETLAMCLNALRPHDQELIYMREAGMTAEQIATRTGKTVGATHTAISRAMKELENRLRDYLQW